MREGGFPTLDLQTYNTQFLLLTLTPSWFYWYPDSAVQSPERFVEVSIWHQGPGKSFKCPSREADLSNIWSNLEPL